jgi:predicted nucleotide-binding protein
VPYQVVVDLANLGRPIPDKVRQTMEQCGSAILIFTKDEEFRDADGNELWRRPSENVVYELGAASYAYEDRVVILKEKGITFPTNFSSTGYIEFEENAIEAKAVEILKELIGFGLVTSPRPDGRYLFSDPTRVPTSRDRPRQRHRVST